MSGRHRNVPAQPVDLDPHALLVVLACVSILAVAVYLAGQLPHTTVYVVLSILLALALDPVVRVCATRFGVPRWAAVLLVLATFVAVLVVGALFVAPRAVAQTRDLGRDLPRVIDDLGKLPLVGARLRGAHVPEHLREALGRLPEYVQHNTEQIGRAVSVLTGGLLAGGATLLLTVALLIDGPRLIGHVYRLVPHGRRAAMGGVAAAGYRVVARYAAGTLFVALVSGSFTLVVALLVGVPLAPLAAVWVAVWEVVPQIGGAVGGVLFVVLAATHGGGTAVLVAALFIGYLLVKDHLLVPVVVGRAVQLSPLSTMIAVLVGAATAGLAGALVAVPVLGALRIGYEEWRSSAE